MTTKRLKPNSVKQNRQLTSEGLIAIRKFVGAKQAPRLKVVPTEKGTTTIAPIHPIKLAGQALLMDALGTADADFYGGLLDQLCDAASVGGQIDERKLNFMLSMVKGVEPKDHLEAMLAAQMAAVHVATMTFGRRLSAVETVEQQDSTERAFNKLARTFTSQLEALKRYRTGGEQKVTVQHVSVSEGGQAIVGNVNQAARETAAHQAKRSVAAISDAHQTPMAIIGEPERAPAAVRRYRKDGSGQPST
jgi:hypothetical protein